VMGSDRIVGGMVEVGGDRWRAARAAPEGLILALPHSGNWDHAGAFCGLVGAPFTTVAERLQPESLYDRFLAFRESLGMRVVPLTGGPRPSATVLREWLAGGGSIALLCDRDLAGNGIPVTFAGRATTMPGGPALLAAQTGAALLPMTCSFTERGWRLTWCPEVPVDGPGRLRDRVGAATQGIADAFAATIARHPEDWHVLGRIWPDVPPDPPSPGRWRPPAEGP